MAAWKIPQDFNDIVVAKKGGAFVRISDVGHVEDSVEDENTTALLNGVPTVLLSIRKQSGLNTVTTVEALKDKLKDIEKGLPPGYKIRITRDQSDYIIASTEAVKEHLKLGSILAALVVLVFLWNWRTTIISAIAIPASIISTFALMYAMNFTLNSITLLALTLSVGIVIDDAIVVLENIFRFIEEKGMNPFEAAIEGTREIGLAVLATTLSLIAVFLPVAFMQGIVGRFMNSFGITMAFAIFISLIVSFTLTPMLASRWIKRSRQATEAAASSDGMPVGLPEEGAEGETPTRPHPKPETHHEDSKHSGIFKPIDAVYTWMLRFSMRHRWIIVLACLLSLFSMKFTIPLVPKNFLPEDDESQFQVTIRASEGTTLRSTTAISNRIADDIRSLKGVDYTVVTIGNNAQQTPNLSTVFVKLVDVNKRPGLTQQDITQQVRTQVLPKYGNLRTSAGPVAAISTGAPQTVITYYIGGPDLKKLTEYSQNILAQFKKIPGVVDADSSLVVGQPELGITPDRQKAADLGVSIADIANTSHLLVGGQKVTDYFESGEQYEVHIRADLPARNDRSVISQMTVPSSTNPGGTVTLDQVVDFNTGTGPAQITRQDRRRNVLITSNVLPGVSQAEVGAALQKIINDQHMPPAYTSGASGTSKELAKAGIAFVTAFMLAIIFMYLILAAQFESWVHPDHHSAGPAADHSVRHSEPGDLQSVAQPLHRSGPAGSVRRGEEERHFAGRPHQPTAGAGHEPLRRHHSGQPRPSAAYPDDDDCVCGGHDPARAVERHGRGDQPGHRVRSHRRADALASADPARHARVLLPLRRRPDPVGTCAQLAHCPPVRPAPPQVSDGTAFRVFRNTRSSLLPVSRRLV